MPITMMFAADLAGVPYGDYARDHRVLADAQVAVAERFDFDYVSAISDPAREASDLGAAVEWFDDQPPAIVESRALLADKGKLAVCACPTWPRPDACATASRRCGCWRNAPARRGSSKGGWKGRAR